MKTRSILLLAAAVLCACVPATHAQTPTPTPPPTGYVDAFRPAAASTLAERQARTATRLTQRLVGGEAQLLHNFRGMYQEVWKNPDGLTPQQVCDGLGPKAGNLFIIAGYMATALYQIDPAGIGNMVNVPPGYTITIHPNGTVTLAYAAPPVAPTP